MPDLLAKVLYYFDKLRGTLEGIFTHSFIRTSSSVHGGGNFATFFKISPL